MFNRIIDLHLYKWKEDKYRKPLLLRGTRQVGKTYAVRKLGQSFKHFVEINFEQLRETIKVFEKDLVPERIIRSLSLIVKAPIIPGKTLLFLDEITRWKQRRSQKPDHPFNFVLSFRHVVLTTDG